MTQNTDSAAQAVAPGLQKKPPIFDGAMIVAGTVVGAGMFSLPIVSAGSWFWYSMIMLGVTWMFMCTTGLLIMEANLNYPAGTSFDNIAKDCLSKPLRIINSLSVAFVLYILTYAYTSGGGSIVAHTVKTLVNVDVPMKLGGFLFALILATIVWVSTTAVSRITAVMMGGMVLAFFMSLGGLVLDVNPAILFNTGEKNPSYAPYLLATLPFYLTSFGYHGNVPGLVKYYNKDPRAVFKTIFYGSLLGLGIFVVWQLSVLGHIPREQFKEIIAQGGNMGVLVGALSKGEPGSNMGYLLQVFSHLAVATSFLGVTLGLFDTIADTLKFDDTRFGRFKTALVTFAPPMVGGIFYPDGFIVAIGFAGVAATIFAVIVPAIMAKATRKKFGNPQYRVRGGNVTLCLCILYGIAVIVCHTLSMFNMLPVYGK